MITQTVTVMERSTENIIIGRRGTYNTEEIAFDLAYLIETYGAGQAVLMVKRPTDATAYPAVTTQTDGKLLWVVSDVDTSFKGHGECELYWYVGQALAKSVIFGVAILRDIGDSSETPPDPYKPWVDELVELGAETERNAEAAAASASDAAESADAAGDAKTAAETAQEAAEAAVEHYPKIVDGYWYVWANGEWVNTGTKAAGTDGKGISSIVSVKTSTSGNVDTYTMTVTYTDGTTETLTFTVTNGVSPSVTITPIAHGHQVTITDAEHPTGQTFEVLDGEVTEAELDGVKATLNHKADVIYDAASGDIASFPDGADGLPVKDLTVGIDPIQDLHGYDSPWPAGGGKNKLPNTYTTDTINGVTFTVNSDGSVKVNGTATARADFYLANPVSLPAGNYIFTYGSAETSGSTVFVQTEINGSPVTVSGSKTFTDEEIGYIRIIVVSGVNINNVTFYPMIRLSSVADATFEPYSNLCPISGWTGCNIPRTGKNLLDNTGIELNPNNLLIARHTGYGTPILLKKGITYTFYCNSATNPDGIYLIEPYTPTNVFSVSSADHITVTPTNDVEVGVNFWWTDGRGARPSDATALYCVVGSSVSTPEAYQGETISVSWQTEAGTVYGGTLDVTTGALTVDHVSVKLGNWMIGSIAVYSGSGGYYYNGANITPPMASGSFYNDPKTRCSHFAKRNNSSSGIGIWIGANNSIFYFTHVTENIPDTETATKFCAWLEANNVYMTYPLAQPQTFQLDPVTVQTLLGQNNIWADCGDVEVEYCADTKLYIDKKIAAVVAALS